jgi:hypothetical protein
MGAKGRGVPWQPHPPRLDPAVVAIVVALASGSEGEAMCMAVVHIDIRADAARRGGAHSGPLARIAPVAEVGRVCVSVHR